VIWAIVAITTIHPNPIHTKYQYQKVIGTTEATVTVPEATAEATVTALEATAATVTVPEATAEVTVIVVVS